MKNDSVLELSGIVRSRFESEKLSDDEINKLLIRRVIVKWQHNELYDSHISKYLDQYLLSSWKNKLLSLNKLLSSLGTSAIDLNQKEKLQIEQSDNEVILPQGKDNFNENTIEDKEQLNCSDVSVFMPENNKSQPPISTQLGTLSTASGIKILTKSITAAINPTSISAEISSDITNPKGLYNDDHMQVILRASLNNSCSVLASQQPLMRGRVLNGVQNNFTQALQEVFDPKAPPIHVMPINTTRQQVDSDVTATPAGTRWAGLVIRRIKDTDFEIEYIDPAHSPRNNIIFAINDNNINSQLHDYSDAKDISALIMRTKDIRNLNINFIIYSTQQQAADIDCGPWTIDNLTRRVLTPDQPLQNHSQQHDLELRRAHNQIFENSQYTLRNNHAINSNGSSNHNIEQLANQFSRAGFGKK